MDLNVNNLSVDRNGRVSFSGLGSNIDFQGVVDSIVAAKRIPIDRLETEVSTNESKIAALGDLRTLLTGLKDSLSTLHGAVSFGNANDAFEIKEAFASSSRTDGATASNAANLIGVTVSNTAPVGGHTLEVLQTAKAHKIASDAITSTTAALGFSASDTLTFATTDANDDPVNININVDSNTNLLGLRDLINNANSGTSATGVSASIVSVSTTEHYLVLTNEQTGTDIALTETAGTPLQTIGLFDGGGVKNELQASQKALMYADGILDQTNTIYETAYQTAATATATTGGTFEFFDSVGASIGTTGAYAPGADLTAIAAEINTAALGITATVVTDGSGVRMEFSSATAFTMTDTGSALTDLGVDNKRRVIERESNTVDDLFAGVTVSLFQAEVGTTINLDIERNLNEIKTSVSTFVESYNELRRFINDQRTLVETQDEDDETVQSGILFSSEALDRADTQLSAIIGGGVAGVNSNYSVLAQIGVDFIPLGSEADPLDANILEIDEATLDNALLNNVEDIRRLFSFDFTPSDPRVSLINFNRNTEYSAAGFTLNVQPNTGSNSSLYSEELDDAYWNKVRSTISADATTAPSGQMTADGLVGDLTDNTHYVTNLAPFTVTAGESYTYSVYAKDGESARDSTRIQLAGGNFPPESYVDVNLTNGTLTEEGVGADGYSIEDAGNGWYRISVTATAITTGPATTEMYSMAGINTVYTGDGTVDTYFSGAQLETAATSSTQVTSFTTINSTTFAPAAVDDPRNSGNFDATEIRASAINTDHGVSNGSTASVTAGETYEYSAYLKEGDRSRARLSLNTGFGANTSVDVRLDAGLASIVTTGAGADSATIEDAGNGWYKVTLTATATSSETTTSLEARSMDAVSGLSFTGDGTTASTYIYDMKMVATSSAVPGDYVPTTGTAQAGVAATANIGGDASGADDGSVTVSATGNSLTVNTGDAAGMQLFFDGFAGPTSVDLNYTVGVGAQMFFAIEDLLDESTGTVETEIDALTDTNVISEDRITEMLARLDIQRRSLLERFIAMETALATNARILESVQASAESLNSSGN